MYSCLVFKTDWMFDDSLSMQISLFIFILEWPNLFISQTCPGRDFYIS